MKIFLEPINMLIKRILKIIFWKRKYESIEQIRVQKLISNASEIHAFEIFKYLNTSKINEKTNAK